MIALINVGTGNDRCLQLKDVVENWQNHTGARINGIAYVPYERAEGGTLIVAYELPLTQNDAIAAAPGSNLE